MMSILTIGYFSSCNELEYPEAGSIADLTPPSASFGTTPSQENYQEINFDNFSGSATDYSWDFGNGQTSTEKNPTVTYEDGRYLVSLTASDKLGKSNIYEDSVIVVKPTSTFQPTILNPGYDDEGDDIYVTSKEPVTADQIIKYYVKEDWFFDKQRSVMDVRIIGISPVINEFDEQGEEKGEKQLFWLYFPECRYVFQNYFVYNRQNDAQRMSFDDLFWKRMFASYIHKESNVYDREVSLYEKNGIKALLLSEKIKNEMLLIEHDLWHL